MRLQPRSKTVRARPDGTCTPVLRVLVAQAKVVALRDEAYCERFAKTWNDTLGQNLIKCTT